MATLLETFTLTDALEDGASHAALPYLELLSEALEDGELSEHEQVALADLANLYDLGAEGVDGAHRGFMRALAREAIEDGKVTRAERRELRTMAELLGQPVAAVRDLLDGEEEARLATLSEGLDPLPASWRLGEPLRVGQRVAFTGCDEQEREQLEQAAESAGVRVLGTVSGRTSMLVTDGSVLGVKAAAAAQLGTRTVTPQAFRVLLRHIQPTAFAETIKSAAEHEPGSVGSGEQCESSPKATTASPGQVRAWAMNSGWEVGSRGRLSTEVRAAYAAAHD